MKTKCKLLITDIHFLPLTFVRSIYYVVPIRSSTCPDQLTRNQYEAGLCNSNGHVGVCEDTWEVLAYEIGRYSTSCCMLIYRIIIVMLSLINVHLMSRYSRIID